MSHEKKEGLAKQIQRQHKILDILLEQNDELRASLTYYQNLANCIIVPPHIIAEIREDENVLGNASQEKLYDVKVSAATIIKLTEGRMFSGSANADFMQGKNVSRSNNADFMQGINVSRDANTHFMDGKNVSGKAYAHSMHGKNVSGDTHSYSMQGKNISGDANVESAEGIQIFEHAIAEKMDGINKRTILPAETTNSDAKIVYGNINKTNAAQNILVHHADNDKPVTASPLFYATEENNTTVSLHTTAKEMIEVKPVSLNNLIFNLSSIIVRSTHQGLMNTATILIRLHDSPKQSLKDLQKLTGLSDDGIGKRIVSMKRFGLITRAAGRQLLLTEKALRAIEKSRM